MSSNCPENTSADCSFCSWTRIFVVNCNVSTCRHNVEYFIQAYISSAGVNREPTGKFCLKSSASNIKAFRNGWTFPRKPPNYRSRASSDFLCAIVHSSQAICLHFCNSFPIPDALEIFQVEASMTCMLNGNFGAEWGILPPGNNVAVIPGKARGKARSFCYRTVARMNLIRNVFPVPPGVSKKKVRYLSYELCDHKWPSVHTLTWECLIGYMTGNHRYCNRVYGSNPH